ncbi:MAG: hypothetical protein HQL20_02895 [Candidatus Omnitrophica bacterium]|nr:hypothetical protein [Candidatus Omnitrophota bacterium]
MDVAGLNKVVLARFPSFGPNKVQELVRLAYEIAVRDGLDFVTVVRNIPAGCTAFSAVKDHLLGLRFPEGLAHGISIKESFAALKIDINAECDVKRARVIYPKKIFFERAVESSPLAVRLRKLFPDSVYETISSYKERSADFLGGPAEFNRRLDNFFVVKEHYDCVKSCPCTPGVVSCGYHNVNFGFGCPFECSYCFLQNYTNSPGIVFPANIDDFFQAFAGYAGQNIRLGSGETADSLAFDHLTGFSSGIVDFFRSYPGTVFEFKTKSDNVAGLLAVAASANIVTGWSVNPQAVIEREEHYSAGLARRLAAARSCAAAGYRTAFHFDPVFYYPGWQADYALVVEDIFRAVPRDSMAWISLGTLRMTVRQKKMIENRFPLNTILSAELLTAPDGKVRYHDFVRVEVYRFLLSLLRGRAPKVPVYLCMEPAEIWREAGLDSRCVF